MIFLLSVQSRSSLCYYYRTEFCYDLSLKIFAFIRSKSCIFNLITCPPDYFILILQIINVCLPKTTQIIKFPTKHSTHAESFLKKEKLVATV